MAWIYDGSGSFMWVSLSQNQLVLQSVAIYGKIDPNQLNLILFCQVSKIYHVVDVLNCYPGVIHQTVEYIVGLAQSKDWVDTSINVSDCTLKNKF